MSIEAMKMAWWALCLTNNEAVPDDIEERREAAIEALRQALAQPDLAKVGEVGLWGNKRQWVGLTDEEIQAERHKLDTTAGWTYNHFARAIEAKLKEKNT